MKKTNEIFIISIILVIIILSIGYALFGENINITGTAKAEGTLKLELTNPQTSGQVGNYGDYNDYFSYSIDGTKVTFTANLQQPDDIFLLTANIENKGAVDAKLNSVSATPNFNRDNVCGLSTMLGDDGCELYKNLTYYDEDTGAFFMAGIADTSVLEINSTNIVIPKGDTSGNYQIMVAAGWDQNWNTDITEPQQITFTVDFGFIQNNE